MSKLRLLRFNGYYYYLDERDRKERAINYILRFYENPKKVIHVSMGLNEENYYKEFDLNDFFPSNNWFNENYEDSGRYEIYGEQISFDCGKVSYKGTISDYYLTLHSISHINGHESTHKYKFIPFEEIKK